MVVKTGAFDGGELAMMPDDLFRALTHSSWSKTPLQSGLGLTRLLLKVSKFCI